jgi:hypothetical protein
MGERGKRGSGGVGVRGRRATVCRPPTPNCRLPFVHAHTHCTDPGVPLHPFGVRQSHLSDIGLFTPLGRARNSMPLRAHSPFSHAFSAFPRQSESAEPPSFDDPSTCNRPGAWERLGASAKGGQATPQKSARPRLPASQRPPSFNVQRSTFDAQRVTPPHLPPDHRPKDP